MALLGVQPVSGTQAADSRFFVPKETESQRLQVAIDQVVALAIQCRAAQPKDRNPFKNPIELTLADIQRRILGYEGLVVFSGLKGNLQRLDEFKIEEGTFAMPHEKITALVANPHWYGDGHDVTPVIDVRIKNREDTVVGGFYSHEDPGRWSQLPLETGVVVLGETPR